jgi:hypothetical protein
MSACRPVLASTYREPVPLLATQRRLDVLIKRPDLDLQTLADWVFMQHSGSLTARRPGREQRDHAINRRLCRPRGYADLPPDCLRSRAIARTGRHIGHLGPVRPAHASGERGGKSSREYQGRGGVPGELVALVHLQSAPHRPSWSCRVGRRSGAAIIRRAHSAWSTTARGYAALPFADAPDRQSIRARRRHSDDVGMIGVMPTSALHRLWNTVDRSLGIADASLCARPRSTCAASESLIGPQSGTLPGDVRYERHS